MLLPQSKREQAMPTGEIMYLSTIVVGFVTFGAVLGWADIRTRRLGGLAPR
jgi:hypothetical protein